MGKQVSLEGTRRTTNSMLLVHVFLFISIQLKIVKLNYYVRTSFRLLMKNTSFAHFSYLFQISTNTCLTLGELFKSMPFIILELNLQKILSCFSTVLLLHDAGGFKQMPRSSLNATITVK